MTVSLHAGKWFVSIQTEREIDQPTHLSKSMVGIDMGIANFATLSDGTVIKPLNTFRNYETKLAKLQWRIAKKENFSNNCHKLVAELQKVHYKISNARKDFLQNQHCN